MLRMKIETEDKRTEKRKTGDFGEERACVFLVKQGFRIIERNYLKKWGEIDIIAEKDTKLHFIEVKTVSRENVSCARPFRACLARETDKYRPEDNLHPWKLKRLSRVIQTYLLDQRNVSRETGYTRNTEPDWQFDIICVYYNSITKIADCEFLEDIIL